MTFVEQIRLDNADIIDALYASDFIQGIVKGTLPKASFDFFITQEVYFLYDYIRAAGACASKAQDEDIPFFINIQDLVYKELEQANSYYSNSDNFNFTNATAPACIGYSSFLLRCAFQASLEIGFAALYASPTVYYLISEHYIGALDKSHPYYPWLAVNVDPNIVLLVGEFDRYINRCATDNPALIIPMGQTVRTSLFYMYYFFQDCFNQRDFYDIGSEAGGQSIFTP